MSVTSYKVGGVDLSNILNTENNEYYGDITTNYNRTVASITSDIGTIFSLQTFSPVTSPQTIFPCHYTAPINQYNTGLSWTGATLSTGGPPLPPAAGNWTAVSLSTTGQYGVACINPGKLYWSDDYGHTWTASTSYESDDPWRSISISSNGTYALACDHDGNSNGFRYRSINGGKDWTVIPGNGVFYSVSISSSGQYGLACTGNSAGRIFYSSDSGATWTIAPSASTAWRSVSISSSGQYGFACNYAPNTGLVYYSNDYGNNWTPSTTATLSNGDWISVSISSSGQYGIASTTNGGNIYYSNDYGHNWTQTTTTSGRNWSSVSISSTGQYGVACNNNDGFAWYSSDYGETWSNITTSTHLYSVSISSNGQYAIGCSGGGGGQIYYSSNTSTTYVNKDLTEVFEPLYKYNTWANTGAQTGDWLGVSMSSTGLYALATNYGSKIYWSNDYGLTWNASNTVDTTWYGISISSTGKYAVAAHGGTGPDFIYYSSDYGQSWIPSTVFDQTFNMSIRTVSISGNGQYGIAGDGWGIHSGNIYWSTDYGVSWTSRPPSSLWVSVSISSTGQYSAACSNLNHIINWSSNYGANWSWVGPVGLVEPWWQSVSISSSGQYVLACASQIGNPASDGAIYWSADYGVNWTLAIQTSTSTNFWQSVSISSTGQYGVATLGTNNQIFYSNNYGVTWYPATNSIQSGSWSTVSISGNGQYVITGSNELFVPTPGNIYRCIAHN